MSTYTLIRRDGMKCEVPFLFEKGKFYISEHFENRAHTLGFAQHDTGAVVIYQPLVTLFETVRAGISLMRGVDTPISVNSGYRSPEIKGRFMRLICGRMAENPAARWPGRGIRPMRRVRRWIWDCPRDLEQKNSRRLSGESAGSWDSRRRGRGMSSMITNSSMWIYARCFTGPIPGFRTRIRELGDRG